MSTFGNLAQKDFIKQESKILSALHILLKDNFKKYPLENLENSVNFLGKNAFDKVFPHYHRKEKGIYYTPSDVADFIVANVVLSNLTKIKSLQSVKMSLSALTKYTLKIIFESSFFDPSCGCGEFLLAVLNFKLKLAKKYGLKLTDSDYISICKSIKGNDIENSSLDIAKMRLFFALCPYLKNSSSFNDLAFVLNENFFEYDFVLETKKIKLKFDYIVGNPPFVEYQKYARKNELNSTHGNIYADFIENSLNLLKQNAAFGFVLPLSYISTARMAKIRTITKEQCERQIILSFADRPDCLFIGAHQKINILIAKKGAKNCEIYTSNYKHWYKNERENLLNKRDLILSDDKQGEFIAKIGNEIEKSIYEKICSHKENLISLQKTHGKSVYLNMRACFWIKAFSFPQSSKEYKKFSYDDEMRDFVLCVLNSSLFWIFWTIVSDCWHLTLKELRLFSVPKNIKNAKIFQKMRENLEKKLEKTKVRIKTAQTEFEYKHKFCKNEIDMIDDELAKIYHLNKKELDYIKNFALKYRLGDSTLA